MWYNKKFFEYGTAIFLILLITFFFGKINYILLPIKSVFMTIFFPILMSGFLYYIFRPLRNFLQKKIHIPKIISILLSFVLVLTIIYLLILYTWGILSEQFNSILNYFRSFDINYSKNITDDFLESDWLNWIPNNNFQDQLTNLLKQVTDNIVSILTGTISTITNISMVIFVVPFIVFFFLKDDSYFFSNLIEITPEKYKNYIKKILLDIDNKLSTYIFGQLIIALCNGILIYIGYLIIGVDYAFVLAVFVVITAIIPFFGPVLGILPAILINISVDPFLVVKIIVVMIITQQIEGNLLSPFIMGSSLKVHPIVIILLLMSGASLFGFIGIIIIIPLYATLKITVKNLISIYKEIKWEKIIKTKKG